MVALAEGRQCVEILAAPQRPADPHSWRLTVPDGVVRAHIDVVDGDAERPRHRHLVPRKVQENTSGHRDRENCDGLAYTPVPRA